MISPQDDLNLRSTGLILMLSFSLALVIVGFIFTRLHKKAGDGKKTPPSAYVIAGKLMLAVGAMLSLVALLFLVSNITGLLP